MSAGREQVRTDARPASHPVSRRLRLTVAAVCLVVLMLPPTPVAGVGWSPGERLPPLILAEINSRIAGRIKVGKLSWTVPDRIVAEQLAIEDPEGQPVAFLDRLEATVDIAALAARELRLDRARLTGIKLNLISDHRGVNIARAFSASASEPSGKPLNFTVDRLVIVNGKVLFRAGDTKVAVEELALDGRWTQTGIFFEGKVDVRARAAAVQQGEVTVRATELSSTGLSVHSKGVRFDQLGFVVGGRSSKVGGEVRWGRKQGYSVAGQVELPAGYWPDGLAVADIRLGALKAGLQIGGGLETPVVKVGLRPFDLVVAGRVLKEMDADLELDRQQLRVRRVGSRVAGGRVDGTGRWSLSDGQLDANLDLAGVQLARLLKLDEPGGRIKGTLKVAGNPGAPRDLRWSFNGALHDLSLRKLALERLDLDTRGIWRGEVLGIEQARLRGPDVEGEIRGRIAVELAQMGLGVRVRVKRPERSLGGYLGDVHPAPVDVSGRVTGTVTAPVFSGEVATAELASAGIAIHGLHFHLDASEKQIVLEELGGELESGRLNGGFRARLGRDGDLTGAIGVAGLHLAEPLDRLGILGAGKADLTARLGGNVTDPEVALELSAEQLILGQARPVDLAARATLTKQRLSVTAFQMLSPAGEVARLSASATIDFDTRALDGHLRLDQLPLGAVAQTEALGVQGDVSGVVQVRGTLDSPRLDGQLRSPRLLLLDTSLGEGQLGFCLHEGKIDVGLRAGRETRSKVLCTDRRPARDGEQLVVGVGYRLKEQELEASLDLKDHDLEGLVRRLPGLTGLSGRGTLQAKVAGPLTALSGNGRVFLRALAVDAYHLGNGAATLTLTDGSLGFRFDLLQQVQGSGRYRYVDGRHVAEGHIGLQGLRPEIWLADLREREGHGRVSGEIDLSYDSASRPALTARAEVTRAELELPPAPAVVLENPTVVLVEDDTVILHRSQLISGGSRFAVQGRYGEQRLSAAITGRASLALLPLLSNEMAGATGYCDVDLTLEGDPGHPIARGELVPIPGARVTLRSLGKPLQFDSGRVAFTERGVEIEKLALQGLGGQLLLAGRVDLEAGQPTAYALGVTARQVVWRSDQIRAELDADVRLDGPAAAPTFSGRVEVLDGRFKERYRLRNFVATATSAGDRRTLAERLPQFKDTRLDLQLVGTDLSGRADMGSLDVDLSGSADLHLTGLLMDPSVVGVIDVDGGRVQILDNRLDVESATIDFPPRPDRRLVPRIDLSARALIEPANNPTGAELPVLLTLRGDSERLALEVIAEDSVENYSSAELIALLATGRLASDILQETSGDVAARLVSRELFSDFERRVEDLFAETGNRDVDAVLELGSSSGRARLRWDIMRRVQVEGETSVSLLDQELPSGDGSMVEAGTFRHALRARMLLADHLPVVDSVALEADWSDLSQADNVYSTLELQLNLRVVNR